MTSNWNGGYANGRAMNGDYHYNPVTEPFSTSIIWFRWFRYLCGSVQRNQMAVTEPPGPN